MRKHTKLIPIILFVVISATIILLSPFIREDKQINYFRQDFVNAEILEVLDESIEPDPLIPGRYTGEQIVRVGILEGIHKYEAYEIANPLSNNHYVYVQKGDKVIASVRERDGDTIVWLYNYKRDSSLYMIIGLFLFVLLIFGKKKGIYSIASLVFTGIVLFFFVLPLVFKGYSPSLITTIGVIIICIMSFLLIGGMTKKSLIAISGTMIGVIVAGVLSYAFGEIVHLNGVNMDRGQEVIHVVQGYNIQIRGLLFSSILIASLGAVMDVAMSIASAVTELKKHNPNMKRKDLFLSGLNIGRDIMGTMSNTLILAFVGSSFNTMLLIWGYQMTPNQFMNIPFVGVEIIQGIAGSIGIVMTVPITALIGSILITRK